MQGIESLVEGEQKIVLDLHVHSTASDGLLTPPELVEEAVAAGLEGMALTDHDTVAGVEAAWAYARARHSSFWFIPGIEMNTDVGPHEVHVLGYFIDPRYEPLLNRLEEIRQARFQRNLKMVAKLNAMGYKISVERVSELAQGGLIGRPHIAQALMEKGYVFSIREAFEKLIGQGKPAYVPRYKFLPEEAVQLIKGAGGVPVLAHPGLIQNDDLVERLLTLGMEGIEVYYPEHSEKDIERYLEMARKGGLLITGGSDYHGTPEEYRGKLGCCGVSRSAAKSIKEKALKSKTNENMEIEVDDKKESYQKQRIDQFNTRSLE
ncbi:PHP domain-containing protein [Syntrophothermus lipocalidus]|uniref:PHP domain protein n=1 Tax=Syntrophothermus lipocalidus (strain DSM 12680 / TGB-C1) TaxID=643648 RepID=D7CM99_SYNLT|nr:PHP domain-containing protein [Syntrophothermus lipocalidus]ADI01834.1 PHP domain protein [Syntrophothermus lipocalidus DSM 12680]